VILVVAVAGVSAYGLSLSLGGPTTTPSATISASITASDQGANTSVSPVCAKLVKSVTSQGYAFNTFLSTASARMGDAVCINVVLQNIDGRNLTLASDGGLSVSYNITEKSGVVVYQNVCTETPPVVVAGSAPVSTGPIGSWSCGGFWSTGEAYQGIIPQPGTYDIVAKASVPNLVGQGLSVVGWTATISLSN
jgi:hypothetical protein